MSPQGLGVLLQAPIRDVVITVGSAVLGASALAMGLGGWLTHRARLVERVLATSGGLLLFLAIRSADIIEFGLFGAAVALHLLPTQAK